MKSVRVSQFGSPDVLQLEEVPDPIPGASQVVVNIRSVGVNPVDTYIREGKYGPREFPYTPGTDAAGVVHAVGPAVKAVKPGDRVYIYGSVTGAYAEMALCDENQVHKLPDRLSFEQGAAIGVPYGTAYRAMFIRGQIKPNETVLIHGASGGVGTAAVQLAAHFGCRVFGTAGTESGLKLVLAQGAGQAFNHKKPAYLDEIMSATGGQGVDLVVEMLANVNLDKDLSLLAKRGRVVVIGNRGRVEIDPRQMMARDSDIRGMSLMHADAAELALIHAYLRAGFDSGTLTPVVGRRFALAEVAAAHRAVLEPGSNGKIVLNVG